MSMLFKRIKDWATSIAAFRAGDVIPVDGPSGTAKMSKDALLALVAQPNGTYPDMTAGGQYVPRSDGDLDNQYSKNNFSVVEYKNTTSNRPTPNGWYFGLAMCGGDSDFGAQIATGMTIDRIFWRNRKEGTSGNWREIPSFPGTTGVGSALQPVYVDSEGTVKACFLGVYSYNISVDYYRLATLTFKTADDAYAGCQFAVSWRNHAQKSGSGILAISFSEWDSGSWLGPISGRLLVTCARGNIDTSFADKLFFYAKKVTNGQYIVGVYSNGSQLISISLMSAGRLSSIDIPSSATTDSGTGITILPYSVPTVTEVYPT